MFYKMALGAVQGVTGSSEGPTAMVLVTDDQARIMMEVAVGGGTGRGEIKKDKSTQPRG